jgi:hypothetical protein
MNVTNKTLDNLMEAFAGNPANRNNRHNAKKAKKKENIAAKQFRAASTPRRCTR